jgi:hypothetical protein
VLGNSSSRAKKKQRSLAQSRRSWAKLGTIGLSDAGLVSWPKLVVVGKFSGTLAKIHRTVWCAPDMSGVPGVQRLFARANNRPCGQRWPRQLDNGREGHRTCSVCHRTVRCPPEKESNQSDYSVVVADRVSGVPPDYAVHPQTEGNQRLLNGTSTTPRPLRAIKGTP